MDKKFFVSNKKIFGEISICKLVEGISIIAASKLLVMFIDAPSEKILIGLTAILSARFVILNICARKFLKLSTLIQMSLRKKIHAEIFQREIVSGELLTLIFDTLQTLDEFLMKVAPNVASIIILLPMFITAALIEDWITAAILLVTLPISPLLLYLIGKATAEKNSLAWSELQRLNGVFKELLSAITTLKMFGRIDTAAEKLKATSEKSSAATLEVLKFAFISSFALELITTLSIALVAVTLGLRLVSGTVDFQPALFLLLIAPEFFAPVRKLGVAFHIVISAKSALERVKKNLSNVNVHGEIIGKLRIPVDIFVENVSYTYPQKKSPALVNVNLQIPAGKITAIVGESGCGKSTLLKLLAGLNLPTAGEIFFSDIPISKMQRESLLSKVAYMPQAPHLFDATLAENFSMLGQLDTSTLNELLAALNLNLNLRAVQKLSRGQLQRLGLIRALLKNSPLILLDEPTAALDVETELLVLTLIKKISPRRTIVIATHRQAVINFADVVIQL